jgi:hypothetical protein
MSSRYEKSLFFVGSRNVRFMEMRSLGREGELANKLHD